MRTFLTILWLGCTLQLCRSQVTPASFSAAFRNRCFGERRDHYPIKMGQRLPSGFTLSSFLDKLEILEDKLENDPQARQETQWRGAVGTAAFILRTLYFNDYKWGATISGFGSNAENLRGIIASMLSNIQNTNIDVPKLLGDDDACFLVLSLAHTVNDTLELPRMDIYAKNGGEAAEIGRLPREVGVVSIGDSLTDAIAIGRTLFGLASHFPGVQEKDLHEAIGEKAPSDHGNEMLEPVATTTVGNFIGSALYSSHINELGIKGTWNDSGCHVEYRLPQNVSITATNAELLGAVDGYILGKNLELSPKHKDWKLSTLLRAYYSSTGFTIASGEVLTFCERRSLFQKFRDTQLKPQVDNMAHATNIKFGYSGDVAASVNRCWGTFISKFEQETSYRSEVCATTAREDEPQCDTPTEVLVILDTSGNVVGNEYKRELQSVVLEVLLGRLNLQRNVSTVRVFASKRHGTKLLEIIPSSGSSSCAGCAARYLDNLDTGVIGSDSVADVLQSLSRMLREDKEHTRSAYGVPSRVVVYMNLDERTSGGTRGADHQITNAINELAVHQSDVKMFAVGYKENVDMLKNKFQIVDISSVGRGDQLSLKSLRDNMELKNLYKTICREPASLQYENCYPHSNRNEPSAVFEGYVTPETVQYWAYQPWHFSASNYLQIKFTAGFNGHIKVCDMPFRNQLDDRTVGLYCIDTTDNMKTISFNATRPCKTGASTCAPLKYAVIGKKAVKTVLPEQAGAVCEGLCRNPQQVKFTVSHEGMYCGGMLSAIFSPFTLLVTLVVILKNVS